MKAGLAVAAFAFAAVAAAAWHVHASARTAGAAAPLRVCADPNNLPFSNRAGEGFENRLAEMIARDLKTTTAYTWWPQRRGFVRNTLDARQCDVVMGMPTAMTDVATTRPYYRSTYVFVTPSRRHLQLHSLDDPRLRRLRVGVQLIGDDFANSPPAHALSARGMTSNVVGYSVLGDYSQPNPPARIVEAVAHADVDVALVWGPLAGYFASRQSVPLDVSAVSPQADSGTLPFTFDISMAVRKGDGARRDVLDSFIATHPREIARLLDDFDVPRVGGGIR